MPPGSLQGMELRWSWFHTYLPNYLTENLPGPEQITLLKMKNSFLGAGGGEVLQNTGVFQPVRQWCLGP